MQGLTLGDELVDSSRCSLIHHDCNLERFDDLDFPLLICSS